MQHCHSKDSFIDRTIRLEGRHNFSFEIIKEVKQDELDYWEDFYIKEFDCLFPKGYNMKMNNSDWEIEIKQGRKTYKNRFPKKVPAQFLEIYLDKEKKKELCKYMNMKTTAGEPAGWTTVKKKLIEAGYEIENKMPRINGKQVSCAIIHYNNKKGDESIE